MIWTAFGGGIRAAVVPGIVGEEHEQIGEGLAQNKNVFAAGTPNVG